MSFIEPKEKKVLTKESSMPFGQYKGEDVSWVLENDPQYLYWVWENIEWLEFSIELEEIVTSETFDSHIEDELKGMRFYDIIGDN